MKLSLRWIFQHLNHSIDDIDIPKLIDLINQKVVEIDQLHTLSFDHSLFVFAQYTSNGFVSESHVIPLKNRDDAILEQWYLIVKKDNQWEWATIKDLGGTKENMLPAISITNNDPAVAIKENLSPDYILEISSSAITHRPDLWGHRGFAREISALLDIPLKPLASLCADVSLVHRSESNKISIIKDFPFAVDIQTAACGRFAATFLPHITQKPSLFSVAVLLSRIDIRPINAVVDGTNVVMMDLGHPMHAFDAQKIEGQRIVISQNDTRSLLLLDGQEIQIQENDIIINDAKKPLSLAGIMGGQSSSVQSTTHSLLIEAAVFKPSVIRTSATFHKKRTEASARFEKNLDPEYAIWAIKRYLAYAQQYGLIDSLPLCLIDSGDEIKVPTILISHSTIEQLLGIPIDYRFILKTLNALEFDITFLHDTYTIRVPSFRAKDISCKEDIVEEIGRLYGYAHIKPTPPAITKKAYVDHNRSTLHALCSTLSFGMRMHEIKNYAFFDELFLQQIGWQPTMTAQVHTPVSQNWKQLINTLIPGLLKAIVENSNQQEKIAFFEIGSIWKIDESSKKITESLHLGLIHAEDTYNFYDGKRIIHSITQLYGINPLWIQCTPDDCPPLLMPYQTAKLMVNDNICIGYAGLIHYEIQQRLGKQVPKSIFVAELNLDAITQSKQALSTFQPLSKLQAVTRDINVWTPKSCTAQNIISHIKTSNSTIKSVCIINFLEKDEWQNHRAVTFRITLECHEKTFTKEEIDLIMLNITQKIDLVGAKVK
jgi:phenylalanyl-tRNA synthetase beta chain